MFSEWTDPYDIDNYYNDLNDLTRHLPIAPSSNTYQQMPIPVKQEMPPEAPTGQVVTVPVPTNSKNAFEVKPDSIFLDNHPVGHQPRYNILQSGPPQKESLWNKHETCAYDWHNIIMYIIMFVVIFMLIQARCQIASLSRTVEILMRRN